MTIKDVTSKVGSGATPTGGDNSYKPSGISLIRSQNVLDMTFSKMGLAFIDEEQAEKLNGVTVEKNDVLLNITGDSIARCCLVPDDVLPARVNQHVSIIRAQNTSPKYLMYFLQYLKPYLLQICRVGGTRNALTKETIEKLPFWEIANSEQAANLLSYFDAKVTNNFSICSELEAMAKLLYDYWFVQFDFPDANGKPYKSSGGKMVWNEELKREIPEEWNTTKIGNVCQVLLGGTPDTNNPEYWNGEIPWLNSGEVAVSPILFAEKTITEKGMNESATSFAKAGAVVMSITRYIRPSILGIDSCFNQSVVAVLPTDKYRTAYLYPVMKANVPMYMSLRTGAQQPHINKETVENTTIICPTDDVLNRYNQIVDPLYTEQINTAKETAQLQELRDFLLPMLMNEQVKIKE